METSRFPSPSTTEKPLKLPLNDCVYPQIVASSLLAEGGVVPLLFWRVFAFLFIFSIGLCWSWFQDIDDWASTPPPVYLTHWGVVATCLYWLLACFNSFSYLRYTRKLRENVLAESQAKQILKAESSAAQNDDQTIDAMEKDVPHTTQERPSTLRQSSSLTQKEVSRPLAPGKPIQAPWTWTHRAQIYLFELSLTLETAITGLYWTLVFDGTCGFTCVTVHAISTAFLFVELCISRQQFRKKDVLFVLLYPTVWVATQLLWIYTGHSPCYSVLTYKDWKSVLLTAFAFLAVISLFFLYLFLAKTREKYVVKRIQSLKEEDGGEAGALATPAIDTPLANFVESGEVGVEAARV